MKYTVSNNRYICAILSDGKEYDFNKQAVRVDREGDVCALYGSKDGVKLMAVIPWINVNMFRVKQKEPVVDSDKISISQTTPSTNVQLCEGEIRNS